MKKSRLAKPLTLDYTDHEAAVKFYDEAFHHPRKRYLVRPLDLASAQAWIRKNASDRHFGWVDPRPVMKKGDIISLDTLYYRNSCGWQSDDWHCEHPVDDNCDVDDETGTRMCCSWNCPIAYEAFLSDLKYKEPDLYREYKDDSSMLPGDSCGDWMVLHSRPRFAAVPNVLVIGIDVPTPAATGVQA